MSTNNAVSSAIGGLVAIKTIDVMGKMVTKSTRRRTKKRRRKRK